MMQGPWLVMAQHSLEPLHRGRSPSHPLSASLEGHAPSSEFPPRSRGSAPLEQSSASLERFDPLEQMSNSASLEGAPRLTTPRPSTSPDKSI
jgi:hypothetical protein